MSIARVAAAFATAFSTSVAVAQFESDLPPRAQSAGVGAIALENEAGKSILVGPTNGFANGAKIAAGYIRDSIEVEGDGYDLELIASGPQVLTAVPLSPTFGFGAAATLLSLETDADVEGISSPDSSDEESDRYFDLFGAYSTKTLTIGAKVRLHQTASETKSTSAPSSTGGGTSTYESEGDASATSVTLGAAFRPMPKLRLAATYRPKTVEKYKTKRKTTRTAANGTVTREESDDPDLLVEDENIRVGAAYDTGVLTVLGGIDRWVPYTEEYELDGSSTQPSSDGVTFVSVGIETRVNKLVLARGNLHNIAADDTKGTGLGLGADIAAGPVEISPALVYETLDLDNDDGPDADGTRILISVGVGATL